MEGWFAAAQKKTGYNEENGEAHLDSRHDNRSWNCGFEDRIDNPEIENLRNQQVKDFLSAANTLGRCAHVCNGR